MDGSRFDAWTRRRFGLVAGGAAASLLGMAPLHNAAAKKKKKEKKKRCRKIGDTCRIGGGQKCCRNVTCMPTEGGSRCCREPGAFCAEAKECCSFNCVGNLCSSVLA